MKIIFCIFLSVRLLVDVMIKKKKLIYSPSVKEITSQKINEKLKISEIYVTKDSEIFISSPNIANIPGSLEMRPFFFSSSKQQNRLVQATEYMKKAALAVLRFASALSLRFVFRNGLTSCSYQLYLVTQQYFEDLMRFSSFLLFSRATEWVYRKTFGPDAQCY